MLGVLLLSLIFLATVNGQTQHSIWCEWKQWQDWKCTSTMERTRTRDRLCNCSTTNMTNAACSPHDKDTGRETKNDFDALAACARFILERGDWCGWEEKSCVGDCGNKKKERTRRCECPSPKLGNDLSCSGESKQVESQNSNECGCGGSTPKSYHSFFSSSYMIFGFVGVGVLAVVLICFRFYLVKKMSNRNNQNNLAMTNLASMPPPTIDPATAPSSRAYTDVAYPRQQGLGAPAQVPYQYNNAGFIGAAPPPTTEMAPPAYDEVVKDRNSYVMPAPAPEAGAGAALPDYPQ